MKECANCRHACQNPAWNLGGLWCQLAVDSGVESCDRSQDWGYDYVQYRSACDEVQPEWVCAEWEGAE